tara:strand:+ start:688 stop:1494 length:807 start_codon:yes stop_codon:yes gene_type:complete
MIIQTPIVYIPFALSSYNSINNYIDISFLNMDKDEDIKSFFLFITRINDYFTKLKKFKEFKFRSSIKEKKNIFPERLRLNFNQKNNIMIFNENKEKIEKSCIKPKMYGKFIIQVSSIWVNNTNKEYGIVWNISQIKLLQDLVYKPAEYSFIDDTNDEDISATNPKYKHYFFMLKLGLSKDTILHKLIQDNMDPSLIDIIIDKTTNSPNITLTNTRTDHGNLFSTLTNRTHLKKVKIVKKKSPVNNSSNLVPSQEDILNAWTRIVKNKI